MYIFNRYKEESDFAYLVMSQLGWNLEWILNEMPGKRFSLKTVCKKHNIILNKKINKFDQNI